MNLGPISLRSLSTAFTRSLEAVGLFTVSTPTDLSSVPDIFNRLGDWVESGWEDRSGDELCGSSGKRSGFCKIVIGLRCFWPRGVTYRHSGCLKDQNALYWSDDVGSARSVFISFAKNGFSLDDSRKRFREYAVMRNRSRRFGYCFRPNLPTNQCSLPYRR